MKEKSGEALVSIVVTYSIKDYLCPCLDSIKEQSYPEFEVIAIDNTEDENFSRGIIERHPGIKLNLGKKNLSYCEALNLGIKQSMGDFILCLNDDVTLDKRFIEEALRGFSIDPKVGMVSGKILRADRKTLDSAGLFLSPWLTAGERGYGLKDKGQFEKEGRVFGVNGAAAFYRKKMLEDIKEREDYFDPEFHFFYEDLDIAWRANRAGWGGYYIPGAVAYHVRGGTARKSRGINKPYARRYLSEELHLDLVKNRYLAIIKNASGLSFFLHLPSMVFYDLIIWAYILLFERRLMKIFILNLNCLGNRMKERISPSINK